MKCRAEKDILFQYLYLNYTLAILFFFKTSLFAHPGNGTQPDNL